jgi:hypothetical protein
MAGSDIALPGHRQGQALLINPELINPELINPELISADLPT